MRAYCCLALLFLFDDALMPCCCGRVVDVSEVTSSRKAVIQSIISQGHHHAIAISSLLYEIRILSVH
jgi:hypothetical protein